MYTVEIPKLITQLEGEFCELNHGPDTHYKKRVAVDFIVQPFGYTDNGIEDITMREMLGRVCSDCIETIQGKDWTLLFCIECCSNHWVYKKFTQYRYNHNILWMHGCPECSEKSGDQNLHDIKATISNPLFVSQVSISIAA